MIDLYDLSALDRYRDRRAETKVMNALKDQICATPYQYSLGSFGALRFTVSQDPDGHCEVLLAKSVMRPSDANVTAFLALIGAEESSPEEFPANVRNGRYFVVRWGVVQ